MRIVWSYRYFYGKVSGFLETKISEKCVAPILLIFIPIKPRYGARSNSLVATSAMQRPGCEALFAENFGNFDLFI